MNRYENQLRINGFNQQQQTKLLQSKIVVIGAGGLGCHVLQNLAAMGIGSLHIIDDDVVNLSNLNRQILFNQKHIGESKAKCAQAYLKILNNSISTSYSNIRLTSKNAEDLLSSYDLIIDCSDNLVARYVIDKASKELQIPFIFGGVRMLEGQIGVFNYKKNISFKDVFKPNSSSYQQEDCNTLGTTSFACAWVAAIQVSQAWKILLQEDCALDGCIHNIDMQSIESLTVKPNFQKEGLKH